MSTGEFPPGARPVLIEVKKRMRDLFEQMDNIDTRSRVSEEPVPAPVHDTSLVFRSVEKKFPSADPEQQLHGTWSSTELAQEARELVTAFNAFDPSRVHFAVLGDWDRGVKLLTRRTIDEAYLLSLFGEHHSERFTFVRT